MANLNPLVPGISETCIEIKIRLNFYFHTSLWCLKKFCEKCNLIFFFRPGLGGEGLDTFQIIIGMCNRKQITPKFRNVKITKASSYTVREINLKKKTEVLFANLYWNVDFVQNEDFEIDLEIQNVATNQVTIPSYVTMLPRYLNLGEPNLLISWKLRIATLRFYILFYWYSVLQSGKFFAIFLSWNFRNLFPPVCHDSFTAWKVSKYEVISGPYFPVFGLNTEIYSLNIRIQSEYRKLQTRNNFVFGHLYSVRIRENTDQK